MFETLRKAMFFGLGAAAMSRDAIREFIDDMVKRGEMSAEEGRRLYSEYTARAEAEGRAVNERIRTQVRDSLREIGVADRSDIAMLESRIAALERRVDNLTETLPGPETTEG